MIFIQKHFYFFSTLACVFMNHAYICSAKPDRSSRVMASMAQNWASCNFAVSNQAPGMQEGKEDTDHINPTVGAPLRDRTNSVSPMHPAVVRQHEEGNSPTRSTHSADSSLLIDESQSDEENRAYNDTNHALMATKRESSFGSITSMSRNNGQSDAVNTDLMWSLTNVNKQQRRKRRPWLPEDDNLILSGIAQLFGSNWVENNDQWESVYSTIEAQFSQDWSLKDVKKHYNRVLKPKLTNQNQNQQQQFIPQTSSNHSVHSSHSAR